MYDDNRNDYSLAEQERMQESQHRVSMYLARVMGWMCVGLFTTLASALACLAVPSIFNFFYNTNAIFAVLILQLVVVAGMSFAMNKMSAGMATFMFMLYAAMMGLTFTSLFILFETFSLIYVFGITAIVFVSLSIYGFATKKDLTRMGTLAIAGLIGIIVAGIFNMFFYSSMMDFFITVIGIGIFLVLTAYDTQKIKAIYLRATEQGYDEDGPELRKMAIFGALTLYLDFINLFLKLLTLLGRRKR